jgi:phosphoribosylglycinamide formyltransferase-1
MAKIVVLISGRGSNLAAICNAGLAHNVKCVISNKAAAPGLEIAKNHNIPSYIVDHKQYTSREEFDKQLADIIDRFNPQYIILAGFMRILSSWFVSHYPNRLINIHPSILPAFTGANAISEAFNAGVKVSGVTIHFVTDKLDHGPIIAQGIVEVPVEASVDDLTNKIHSIEHIIYPFVIKKLINGKVNVSDDGYVTVEKTENDSKLLGDFSNKVFY